MDAGLIAPCGMNCSLCKAYLREKDRCLGCRVDDEKPVSIMRCAVRSCAALKRKGWRFCSNRCERYPCARLKALDKRYRAKYCMSMIENLESIRKDGVRKFVKMEIKKWTKGDRVFCVHDKEYHVMEK